MSVSFLLPEQCENLEAGMIALSEAMGGLLEAIRRAPGDEVVLNGVPYAGWQNIPGSYRAQIGAFGSDTGTDLRLTKQEAYSLASQLHAIEVQTGRLAGRCNSADMGCLAAQVRYKGGLSTLFLITTIIASLGWLFSSAENDKLRRKSGLAA